MMIQFARQAIQENASWLGPRRVQYTHGHPRASDCPCLSIDAETPQQRRSMSSRAGPAPVTVYGAEHRALAKLAKPATPEQAVGEHDHADHEHGHDEEPDQKNADHRKE